MDGIGWNRIWVMRRNVLPKRRLPARTPSGCKTPVVLASHVRAQAPGRAGRGAVGPRWLFLKAGGCERLFESCKLLPDSKGAENLNVSHSIRRNAGSGLHSSCHSRPNSIAERIAWQTGDSRFLSSGLESGLRRSN